MVASLTTLVPGEYLQNSTITNPVKIVPDPTNGNGLSGTYKLSGSPNASGVVGSSGSPVVITGTTITDGGAIAPGPALTIDDKGPAITFPLTNIGAKTGTLALSGTYDVPTLGGTPSGIQVLVSNSANGPPLTGCTPCNWGALTATISGGKWSGTIAGIPGGGPYLVSVRATNGTAYATLPNSVKVGFVFVPWGQGQVNSMQSAQSGTYTSFFSGLWGYFGWSSPYAGIEHYLQGPPVTANFVPGQPSNYAGDRFGVQSNGSPLSEAVSAFDQELGNIFGVPTSFMSATRDGIGVAIFTLGNATQTQTVGAGDGSNSGLVLGVEILPNGRRLSSGTSGLRRREPHGRLVHGSDHQSRQRPDADHWCVWPHWRGVGTGHGAQHPERPHDRHVPHGLLVAIEL